jgi:Ca2+-binding EF-hand superfamily protein
MIDEVDEDGSGMIEFDEFLMIINDKGEKDSEEPEPKLKKPTKSNKKNEAEEEAANKT